MAAKKIVIVGLGYVGLPLAMVCAEKGFLVHGIDTDEEKIASLRQDVSPIEDVRDSEIEKARKLGNFVVDSNFSIADGFDVALLALPTPLNQGEPDLTALVTASENLASFISEGSLIIVESTVFPGCTESIIIPILEKVSGLRCGRDFGVAYSPERINPGDKEWTLRNTPKITSGVDEESSRGCESFYAELGIPTFPVSTVRTAEFTKLLENTFRFVNISFVNELMTVAEDLEIDLWESIGAADSKPFGFVKFTPGPGVGGHCLPVDSVYLSWITRRASQKDLSIVDAATEVNRKMPEFVASRVRKQLQLSAIPVSEAKVLLLGLAYKADIGDVRESPALALANILNEQGATVYALDPWVRKNRWPTEVIRAEEFDSQHFDIAVLMTAHSDKSLTAKVLESGIPIIDTRNHFDANAVNTLGRSGLAKT